MNMEVAGMSYLQMLSISEREDTSWMSIGSETFQVEKLYYNAYISVFIKYK